MYGEMLKKRISEKDILPLIGIYDVFSAILASEKFEAVFCSGYGFSASHYGLPDEGFINWSDMLSFVGRVRQVAPNQHIIVDIDEGYGDPAIASNVAMRLESIGASAVILEDQKKPKKCGHLPGKEILSLDDYVPRLESVLQSRVSMYVIARTDSEGDDAVKRARLYADLGADAVLVEGISDLGEITRIRKSIPTHTALAVNLIGGGKTPPCTLSQLQGMGVNIANFSTPCLFAAHAAIKRSLDQLVESDGNIDCFSGEHVSLIENNKLLKKSLSDMHSIYDMHKIQ